MAGSPKPSDFATRIRELERRLSVVERTSKMNSAAISSGGLLVQDSGSVTIESPGDLLLVDPDGTVAWRASEDPVRFEGFQAFQSTDTVTTTLSYFAPTEVCQIPDGFRGPVFLRLDAFAGVTTASAQRLTIQCSLRTHNSDGSITSADIGPLGIRQASTASTPSTANTFAAIVLTPGAEAVGFSAQMSAVLDTGASLIMNEQTSIQASFHRTGSGS